MTETSKEYWKRRIRSEMTVEEAQRTAHEFNELDDELRKEVMKELYEEQKQRHRETKRHLRFLEHAQGFMMAWGIFLVLTVIVGMISVFSGQLTSFANSILFVGNVLATLGSLYTIRSAYQLKQRGLLAIGIAIIVINGYYVVKFLFL